METVQHYTAYRPRPFTATERGDVTILYGGLTWKHERMLQGTFENMGYRAEALPNIARADLDTGKELTDVGACCPTTFTTGNLANFLKKKSDEIGRDEVAKRYVYVTAGACGPCRFGQYHESYTMALDGIGLRDFRLFLLDQGEMDGGAIGGGGIEVNLPFSLGVVWSMLCGDLLTDLEYATRPYEVVPGTTDRVLAESVELLYEAFRDRPKQATKLGAVAWHLLGRYFSRTLHDVRKRWDAIEVDRLRVKPRVKITGEFWLQTHEGDGNYDIKRWLEREGAEIIAPPIAVWLDYLIHQASMKLMDRAAVDPAARRKARMVRALRRLYLGAYARLRRSLGNIPHDLPDQDEIAALAEPFYSFRLDGGEGHMLVGKALQAHLHKKAHMICELTPYSCMPNTMSIGAMANVQGKYPDLLYAPIEVKGDAEVHALSRCQMVLSEAKKRAQREMEDTLDRSRVTLDQVRGYLDRNPKMKRAMQLVPHDGCAGTAANTVRMVARRLQ